MFNTSIDWSALFLFDQPVLETIMRGSVIYLSLFLLLRVILKRQAGSLGMTDLLVIVLIADAAQNGMAGEYQSISTGVLLVGTLIFWNFALEWLAFHFHWFERLIAPPPLPLVKDGHLLWRNMRKEFITEEELMSKLRENGANSLKEVKKACMEGDGKISVVKYGG